MMKIQEGRRRAVLVNVLAYNATILLSFFLSCHDAFSHFPPAGGGRPVVGFGGLNRAASLPRRGYAGAFLLQAAVPPPNAFDRSNVINNKKCRPIIRGGGTGSSDEADTAGTTKSQLGLAASTTELTEENSSSSSSQLAEEYVSADNLNLLSERGRDALVRLITSDAESKAQLHVYDDWPEAGVQDENKMKLADQLADLDESYPGGLDKYISRARDLLRDSSLGLNPFEEYTASVPSGETLVYEDVVVGGEEGTGGGTAARSSSSSMTFGEAEQIGLGGIADVAFVLVAGGLGERLGFSGIKLSLETNLCTEKSYLEVYCKFIQAMHRMAQKKVHHDTPPIPLVIMTSGDTDGLTRKLLEDNNNFGMEENQIRIVCQDKVPALKDSNAGLSLTKDNRWEIETKPHGHGDVHHLLLKHGLVDEWLSEGRKHVCFLQDTNVLVINAILPALGVSIAKGFHMNSICIPRLAGEAAGGIARLEHKSDPTKSLTINVEYNQLDPLLRTNPPYEGDVADPDTGYSPYPGNANNLVFELGSYARTLKGEDEGVVTEFVNPKYKEGSRTEFKKPTRLECMMQDFPKLMQKEMGMDANVGFTMLDRWYTFSPAKNALEAGVADVKKGSNAPGTMCSAESDKYISNQRKLRLAGVDVPVTEEDDKVSFVGIPVTPGPRIVLCPGFAITQEEVLDKITGGKVTKRSSLVLEGQDLHVKDLDLDGALVIRTQPGCHVTVDGLKVRNKGWEFVKIDVDDESIPESVRIRGYTMNRHEALEIYIDEPGRYHIGEDGVVSKLEEE